MGDNLLVWGIVLLGILWLVVLTIPFWTSYLLRVFAWKIILGFNGVINSGLMRLDLIEQPLLVLRERHGIPPRAHRWMKLSRPLSGVEVTQVGGTGQPSAALPSKSTRGLAGRKAGRPSSAGDFRCGVDRFVPKD